MILLCQLEAMGIVLCSAVTQERERERESKVERGHSLR